MRVLECPNWKVAINQIVAIGKFTPCVSEESVGAGFEVILKGGATLQCWWPKADLKLASNIYDELCSDWAIYIRNL